ncbi:TetR/AcrR family transcriptional regulator, partial [Streptomyces sp. NPDC007095]
PLGHVLHRDLRARSLAERTLAGAADAPLVASAVAATFAGVLADWLHGLLEGTPEEVADQVWQLLVALHMSR